MDTVVLIQENTNVMLENTGMEEIVKSLNKIIIAKEIHIGVEKDVLNIQTLVKILIAKMDIIGSNLEKHVLFNNLSIFVEAVKDDLPVYMKSNLFL
jgi:hypothetical protein